MLELLGGDPEFFEPNSEPVPEVLVEGLRDGFKEVDGCIVPGSFPMQTIWSENRTRTNNVDDEAGFECGWSKCYISDFVSAATTLSELARIGCAYAMYLRRALLESALYGKFRVIVDVEIPDAECAVGNQCSVRFHKFRPDQTWLADDLELYLQNALCVVDFEKS